MVTMKERQKEWRQKNPEYNKKYLKEWRHRKGISKNYNHGLSETKEYQKLERQKAKAVAKGGGELSIKTIQMVYEDNIKKFGTLTCYLCFIPIEFGNDSLEHKIPFFRGGNNQYNNLAVSCKKCNSLKGIKTEEEYRKGLK